MRQATSPRFFPSMLPRIHASMPFPGTARTEKRMSHPASPSGCVGDGDRGRIPARDWRLVSPRTSSRIITISFSAVFSNGPTRARA